MVSCSAVTAKKFLETFLVVQWLRLRLPMRPSRGAKIHMPQGQKTKKCKTEAIRGKLNEDFRYGPHQKKKEAPNL